MIIIVHVISNSIIITGNKSFSIKSDGYIKDLQKCSDLGDLINACDFFLKNKEYLKH